MIADPSAYSASAPQRGVIIIFKRDETKALWIKRVVGLPDDMVTQSDDGIQVNGKPAALIDLANRAATRPR